MQRPSVSFTAAGKWAKSCVGPIWPRPGPTLPIAVKAAVFLAAFAFLWRAVLTLDERATFSEYVRARLGRGQPAG